MVIEVKDLKKVYGKGDTEFEALRGIDLSIKKGESVAIVGKSGSGKSTLMHILSLMDSPTTGSLRLFEKETHTLKKKELDEIRNKTFGFVFQQFFLNNRETVLENVTLPLKIAGYSKKERNLLGMEALRSVELEDKAKNKANDLSGGQKQRVCIARALVNNPDIIYLDEPTGALDSNTSKIIEDILFKLHKEKNITLITVTHDPDLARRFEREVEIKDGLIIEERINK